MLLVGWFSDHFRHSHGVLCFSALITPFAVAGYLAKKPTLLKTPREHVDPT